MSEQASPRVVGIRDLAELRTAHAADAVVPGQAVVDKRVVGSQQLQRRPIFADQMLEEQLGLCAIASASHSSKYGNDNASGSTFMQVLKSQPLRSEARAERIGSRSASIRRT